MMSIVENLQLIQNTIINTAKSYKVPIPRLIAVSKTKPFSDVIEAYKGGQRCFGENYVNELAEKASIQQIVDECPEIQWYFIGHLQRNNVNKLLSVPNLKMIQTIDSVKLAEAINNAIVRKFNTDFRLDIMIQVNTSMETNKSGIQPDSCTEVVNHVITKCSSLTFRGLMTIGSLTASTDTVSPNPDFQCLRKCKENVCQELCLSTSDVELSMGMSSDFEEAIKMETNYVRIGSKIFGARIKP